MGCRMIAFKRTGTDRINIGIDMISFIRIFERVCIVSVYIFLTETCLQKVSHPITTYLVRTLFSSYF